MRIRGSGPRQPLRSLRVSDVQRVVVARIAEVDVDRNRRRGRTLSVVMRLHQRKCGKTWRKIDSRWKRRRGEHGRVARADVGIEMLTSTSNLQSCSLMCWRRRATTDDLSDGAGSGP